MLRPVRSIGGLFCTLVLVACGSTAPEDPSAATPAPTVRDHADDDGHSDEAGATPSATGSQTEPPQTPGETGPSTPPQMQKPATPPATTPGGRSKPTADVTSRPATEPGTPNAARPSRPAMAGKQTARGAAAFTRYYFEVLDHAYASGDTRLLAELTGQDCTSCHGVITSIRTVYDGGGSTHGGATVVRRTKVEGSPAGGSAEVVVTFDSAAYAELTAEGEVAHSEPAQRGQLVIVELGWVGGSWRVEHIADV